MRLFLAVFPPPAAQAAAHGLIESLQRPGDGVAWMRRESLHFTLRFLGELDEPGAARAAEAAREAAAGGAPFEAALGAPGAFPSPRRAKVLWLGMAEGGEALSSLARMLETALAAHGFEREARPFAPHLTLGRVRVRDVDWSGALEGSPAVTARFRVDRLLLIESRLSPKGSSYASRVEAPLGAAAEGSG
jgi:2'-5' RNA ligase